MTIVGGNDHQRIRVTEQIVPCFMDMGLELVEARLNGAGEDFYVRVMSTGKMYHISARPDLKEAFLTVTYCHGHQ